MFKFEIKTNILKAMNRFASTDGTRTILCGVHLEAKRNQTLLVATDGRRIAVLEIGEPAVDDFQFTIPSALINALPAGTETELVYGPETGEIQANFSDFSVHAVAIESRGQAQYPKWRQVIPSPWPKTLGNRHLSVNMQFLSEACRIGEELVGDAHTTITSAGHDGDPICIRRQNFTAIVMPLRVTDDAALNPPTFAL